MSQLDRPARAASARAPPSPSSAPNMDAGVEARQAQPVDAAVASDQGSGVQVADQGVVLDLQVFVEVLVTGGHGPILPGRWVGADWRRDPHSSRPPFRRGRPHRLGPEGQGRRDHRGDGVDEAVLRADGRSAYGQVTLPAQPEQRLRLPRLRLARAARSPSTRGVLRERRQGGRRGGDARGGRARSSSPSTRSPTWPSAATTGSGQQGRLTQPMVLRPGGDALRADRLGRGVLA